jgi:hypothetical protein
MAYQTALNQAWKELKGLSQEKTISVKFLSDEYLVDIEKQCLYSLSCNIPAKDYLALLILHYLLKKLRGLPELENNWIPFRELEGGEIYYPVFRKRVLERVLKKYGQQPKWLSQALDKVPSKRIHLADAALVIYAFERVPILIAIWAGDEDFAPEVEMLFDSSISKILSTEDIVVLAEFVARTI